MKLQLYLVYLLGLGCLVEIGIYTSLVEVNQAIISLAVPICRSCNRTHYLQVLYLQRTPYMQLLHITTSIMELVLCDSCLFRS